MKINFKIKKISYCLVAVCFFNGSFFAKAIAHNIEIPSKDGQVKLRLYIDYPTHIQSGIKVPAIIIVPGSGNASDPLFNPMDPDFNQPSDGLSGLSEMLNKEGVAVIRYDTRGEFPHRDCMQGKKKPLSQIEYVKQCKIDRERMTVNFKSLREDIVEITNYVRGLTNIDSQRIGFIGNSEGFSHVANVVGNNYVKDVPIIIGLGALIEAPLIVYQKQKYLRLIELLKNQFTLSGSNSLKATFLIEIAERELSLGKSVNFLGKEWVTLEDINELQIKADIEFAKYLEKIDLAGENGMVMEGDGNCSWVERSFTYLRDFTIAKSATVEPLKELAFFNGIISIYHGSKDTKVDVYASEKLLTEAKTKQKNIRSKIYPDLGHYLEDQSKQISPIVLNDIVMEIASAMR